MTGRAAIDLVIRGFFAAAESQGCIARQPAIPCSSGFDPSVRFIGSHISVLLNRMLTDRIPEGGVAMWQDCVRTRSLSSMARTGRLDSPWGSYFIALGALLQPTASADGCRLLRRCLQEELGIADLEVSFFKGDSELGRLAHGCFVGCTLRADEEVHPYRHKVGVPSVRGKNLNVAIRGPRGLLEPIANVIVYADDGRPCGVEVALGTTTVVKASHALRHPTDAYRLPPLPVSRLQAQCWRDAAVTGLHLLREGLPIRGQHNRNRLLRTLLGVVRDAEATRLLEAQVMRSALLEHLDDWYGSSFVLKATESNEQLVDRFVAWTGRTRSG